MQIQNILYLFILYFKYFTNTITIESFGVHRDVYTLCLRTIVVICVARLEQVVYYNFVVSQHYRSKRRHEQMSNAILCFYNYNRIINRIGNDDNLFNFFIIKKKTYQIVSIKNQLLIKGRCKSYNYCTYFHIC